MSLAINAHKLKKLLENFNKNILKNIKSNININSNSLSSFVNPVFFMFSVKNRLLINITVTTNYPC